MRMKMRKRKRDVVKSGVKELKKKCEWKIITINQIKEIKEKKKKSPFHSSIIHYYTYTEILLECQREKEKFSLWTDDQKLKN